MAIANHLFHLKIFFLFLSNKKKAFNLDIENDKFQLLISQIEKNNAFYRKSYESRKQENLEKKLRDIPTKDEMVNLYNYMDDFSERNKIIQKCCEQGEKLSSVEIQTLQDMMITECVIYSGARPSACSGMTVDELVNAEDQGRFMLVRVKDHKTFNKYGPYSINMRKQTHTIMTNFVNVQGKGRTGKVITTSNGNKFNSSQVNVGFKRTVSKSGAMPDKNPAIRHIRSFLSSDKSLYDGPLNFEKMADSLSHTTGTQKKHYRIRYGPTTANFLEDTIQKFRQSAQSSSIVGKKNLLSKISFGI